MQPRNIVVLGASAGGLEAIHKLIKALPAEFNAALLIVWHMGADNAGILPDVLNSQTDGRAGNAVDGEPIVKNRIYVAPPDKHMLIDNGHIRLTKGPKENRFRPAIDPLFRSASFAYGPRVIGIILTGALDDGVAGLWIIKKYGGIAIAQEPSEALVPSMPLNAIRNVKIDYRLKLSEIAAILPELCAVTVEENVKDLIGDKEHVELEHRAALGEALTESEVFAAGKLTPYTCPECSGVLAEFKDGDRSRYRCHTGHAFSADTLLASLSESIEHNLWSTIRAIQESTLLLTSLGDHHSAANQPKLAGLYFKKAKESREKEQIIRQTLQIHEALNTDKLERSAGTK